MRIIRGKYKGAKVSGYDINGTRPTMDRVKESLFGIIQPYVKHSICLDLFAGSGSLGLEAISSGASACTFVDNNKKVIKVLETNIKLLKIAEETVVINSDFGEALKKFQQMNKKFDIIFLDPPYDLNLINPALSLISKYDLLNEEGLIICEYETEKINALSYEIWKERSYGLKKVTILKKSD